MVEAVPEAYIFADYFLKEENFSVNCHPFQAKYGKLVRKNCVQPNLLRYMPTSNSAVLNRPEMDVDSGMFIQKDPGLSCEKCKVYITLFASYFTLL